MNRVFQLMSIFVIMMISIISAALLNNVNLSKSSSGYNINFSISSYDLRDIDTGTGVVFSEVVAEGCGYLGDSGMPHLPTFTFTIAISENVYPYIQNIQKQNEETATLTYKVYPNQPPTSKCGTRGSFIINNSFYSKDTLYQQPFATISEPFILCGIKGINVRINPFSYNPVRDELTLVKQGSFTVKCPYERIVGPQEPHNPILRSVFQNYNYYDYDPTLPTVGYNTRYLIITDPQFEFYLHRFVTWKRDSIGYKVDMFTTNETGTSTTAIKAFIQNRYDNRPIRPTFILLVGDNTMIPGWEVNDPVKPWEPLGDHYYTRLDGDDDIPDAFIGRFDVSNSNEIQIMREKTIRWERDAYKYPQKATFIASKDNTWTGNYYIAERTHDYCIENYFEPNGYTCMKRYLYRGATKEQIIGDIDENDLKYAIYSGICGLVTQSWGEIPINNEDIGSLNNWIAWPFIFSFTAMTGDYSSSDCFMKTWLSSYDNGGTFSFGSSVDSDWLPDEYLQKSIFENWHNDNGIFQMGVMTALGKAECYKEFFDEDEGDTYWAKWYLQQYNNFGDPSILVYYPEWRLPTGGHDCYMIGNRVMYDGNAYKSTMDGNVWPPPTQWDLLP